MVDSSTRKRRWIRDHRSVNKPQAAAAITLTLTMHKAVTNDQVYHLT
jgi:hypothetical protein